MINQLTADFSLRLLSVKFPVCERSLLVQVKVHERNVSVNNVEVKARHLWGCDVYTDDSDVVAALMHCGFHEAAKAHNPPGALGSRGLRE